MNERECKTNVNGQSKKKTFRELLLTSQYLQCYCAFNQRQEANIRSLEGKCFVNEGECETNVAQGREERVHSLLHYCQTDVYFQ